MLVFRQAKSPQPYQSLVINPVDKFLTGLYLNGYVVLGIKVNQVIGIDQIVKLFSQYALGDLFAPVTISFC